MTATKLRYVLIGLIVVMFGGFATGAWWVDTLLAKSVRETDNTQIDAEVSTTELQQLKSLQKQLLSEKDIIDRAKQIAASSNQYRYQDQVIKDISDYASRYGIAINTFDFTTTTGQNNAQVGAKKTPFTVTLRGPLPYTTFLKFLRAVEQNLTKIQVTSLSLAPDKDPSSITNPTVSMEVYLKN